MIIFMDTRVGLLNNVRLIRLKFFHVGMCPALILLIEVIILRRNATLIESD